MNKKWTGERLETFIHGRDAIDHLHRYSVAIDYIQNKTVLDIACGEGYGSALMCKYAGQVYGVDISIDVITHASSKYVHDNLNFLVGNADGIPLGDNSVDVVVSFETIEHHSMHLEMLREIKRVLKKDGLLLISTPDKLYYTDKRNFKNEFHTKELYLDEFEELISAFFSKIQVLQQQYCNGNSIIDVKNNERVFYVGNYSDVGKIEIYPLYIIIVASDARFNEQNMSFFDGSLIVQNWVDEQSNIVYTSNSYRLGHMILLPLKMIKRIYKSLLFKFS